MAERNISVMSDELTLRSLRLPRFAGSPTFRRRPFRPALRRGPRKALSAAAWVLSAAVLIISLPSLTSPQARNSLVRETAVREPANNLIAGGNLQEQIPNQYCGRYSRWKATFLSADVGRRLWLRYAGNPAFRLTIIVSKGEGQGAEVAVDGYQWSGGKLVAATIILGHQIDQGYPLQFYYPVLGSLAYTKTIGGDVLAAAKIAHEFGHIDRAANSNATSYQSENELSNAYASHFMSNGHNTDDSLLVDLSRRMGGTPTEISAQREYWAETYALRYLLDKLGSHRRRRLLKLVRHSLASAPGTYSLPSQIEWRILTAAY